MDFPNIFNISPASPVYFPGAGYLTKYTGQTLDALSCCNVEDSACQIFLSTDSLRFQWIQDIDDLGEPVLIDGGTISPDGSTVIGGSYIQGAAVDHEGTRAYNFDVPLVDFAGNTITFCLGVTSLAVPGTATFIGNSYPICVYAPGECPDNTLLFEYASCGYSFGVHYGDEETPDITHCLRVRGKMYPLGVTATREDTRDSKGKYRLCDASTEIVYQVETDFLPVWMVESLAFMAQHDTLRINGMPVFHASDVQTGEKDGCEQFRYDFTVRVQGLDLGKGCC